MIALRFPATAPLQDEAANELVREVIAGDFAAFRKATHAGDDFVKRVQEGIERLTRAFGKVTRVMTIGQRTFVFESEPEIHSYVRVTFGAAVRCSGSSMPVRASCASIGSTCRPSSRWCSRRQGRAIGPRGISSLGRGRW